MKHLTFDSRLVIYKYKLDLSQKEIANIVGVHPNIVCRELKRNHFGFGYNPRHAEKNYFERRQGCGKKYSLELRNLMLTLFCKDFSPEQIVGRMRLEGMDE